ncbi:hypothetical protein CVU82_04030 [Candidatus Falkowbacteria bacterium HGW-Falkowbacteria-1]|jgi:hypothetical protein|uniref:Uncharacterized protein n=1 Tax=Candidatus Falkowbacteria bacterium HGW-Falkowbacteria-1 TaxID=2013768 RepID=A0A2N2E8Z8_9BACT|nr:MAG: hypothetical protein CVU82_04030 [Candidatus Falkowbacteria bacterium HGW-Falkowbacteria-1]
MEIVLKPKGRGASAFLRFLGKKSLLTNSVNTIVDSDVCKMLFFSAICNKTKLFLTDGDKNVELFVDSIEASVENNEVMLIGFASYKVGYGGGHVKVAGSVKF